MKEYKISKGWHFIGIDVSKNTLDFAVISNQQLLMHSKIGNNPDEIALFLNEIKGLKGFNIAKCTFGLEYTGIYNNHVLNVLIKRKAKIVQQSALEINNSLGILRGKNDKSDSIRIAQYLQRAGENIALWEPKRLIIQKLASLLTLRSRILSTNKSMRDPIKESAGFVEYEIRSVAQKLCENSLNALKEDLAKVDKFLVQLYTSDERINRLMKVITSVPSIGILTALQILVTTNEFRDISCPKKFACYAGVAPFEHTSGISVSRKTKVSHLANKKIKSLLHVCSLTAIRNVPEIKEYYMRKKNDGKHSMSVLNAIRTKLIKRVFACVKGDRLYQSSYQGRSTRPTDLGSNDIDLKS